MRRVSSSMPASPLGASDDKRPSRHRLVATYACERCTASVTVTVKATVWCTRCGRRMKPAPAGIGTASKPKRAATPSRDPLANAFARLRAESQARAQRLDHEAAA